MLHETSLFLKNCQAATANPACLAGHYALQARQAAVVKAALHVAAAVMTCRCQVQSFHAEYKYRKSLPISALQSTYQDTVN